ncbi:MAG TPA: hypothetical protein VI299_07665 [Polyangiales bacterium]
MHWRCGLALVLWFVAGCVSSYPIPMAQAPLFTKAGETELGAAVRPLGPRRGMAAFVRVAATDHVRLGALVNGAVLRHSRDWGFIDGPFYAKSLRALYAEGFAGYEGSNRMFRYGALIGVGYGESSRSYERCLQREPRGGVDSFGPSACLEERTDHVSARYLRSYGQLHMGFAPNGGWRGAFGVRVPYIHDFENPDPTVVPEGFVSNSVTFAPVRFELQVLAGAKQRISLGLSMMVRLGPGSRGAAGALPANASKSSTR